MLGASAEERAGQLPKRLQAKAKRPLPEIMSAECREDAEERRDFERLDDGRVRHDHPDLRKTPRLAHASRRFVKSKNRERIVQACPLARSSIAWQASINTSNGSASSSNHPPSTIRA